MFNTYVDASRSVAEDRRDEEWESLINRKISEVQSRLATPEGALQHVREYEETKYLAEMICCFAKGDWLGASIACDKIIMEQAEREAEEEWDDQ